jgi:hypothetical protein
MWRLEKYEFWFRVNIHKLTNRRPKLFFLSHECDLFEESWSYLPDVKHLPLISFSNCLPDFAQYRDFRHSWYSRVFTLSYFSISVTFSYPSAYMTFVLFNCTYGLSFAVIHFTLTSIPARFWTQPWSVLLSVSYCKLVFSFPLHLPHLSSTFTRYQFRIFPMNSVLIPNNNQSRFSHSPGNWNISPAMIN